MTIGAELPCPKCGQKLDSLAWHDAGHGSCRICRVPFDFVGFPALTFRRPDVAPKAVLVAEHATCFHHPENQAEFVCEGCGRFLCSVCAIKFGGKLLCPGCIKAGTRNDAGSIGSRTLYPGIAMSLAVLPLLAWPVTLVSAPTALGVVIAGWKKPRSLIEPGRGKMIAAAVIAVVEIAGWVALFAFLWLRKKHK
jgi:B-box zinc finger protein